MSDTASKPLLSATVLLVRDREDIEVLMVARHYQIDFAAGALVFPGGKANSEDADPAWVDHVDGDYKGDARAARIAAVREAFEEAGILLARPLAARGAGAGLVSPEVADRLAPLRGPVDRREESFLAMIRDNDLVLALDTLVHFGHWITPDMMPKRFDTHFFLAHAPTDQIASHDGRETTDAIWINPLDALAQEKAGKATIIFPTRMNLIKLGRAGHSDAAIEMFGRAPVVTVLPKVGTTEDGVPCLHIPEEAGYGQTTELLTNIKV